MISMKKVLFVFLTIVSLNTLKVQGQHFGFKGGLNLSNLSYKDVDATDYKVGFHAGILNHIHVSPHFAIQPEVVYSRQGGINQIRNSEHRFNLDYINVPVLAQYMFGKGYRLEAGPQVGFLVNAREKLSNDDLDAKGIFKPVDSSFAV